MEFRFALDLMKQGKKVRRKIWNNPSFYFYFESLSYNNLSLTHETILDWEDLTADDWIEYEEI